MPLRLSPSPHMLEQDTPMTHANITDLLCLNIVNKCCIARLADTALPNLMKPGTNVLHNNQRHDAAQLVH